MPREQSWFVHRFPPTVMCRVRVFGVADWAGGAGGSGHVAGFRNRHDAVGGAVEDPQQRMLQPQGGPGVGVAGDGDGGGEEAGVAAEELPDAKLGEITPIKALSYVTLV